MGWRGWPSDGRHTFNQFTLELSRTTVGWARPGPTLSRPPGGLGGRLERTIQPGRTRVHNVDRGTTRVKRRHVSWAMRARQWARRSSFSLLVLLGRPPTVKAREDDHLGDLLRARVRVAWHKLQRMPTAAGRRQAGRQEVVTLSTAVYLGSHQAVYLLSTVYRLPPSTTVYQGRQ